MDTKALTLIKTIVRQESRPTAIKLLVKAGMTTKQANSCYDRYQKKDILVGVAKGMPKLTTEQRINQMASSYTDQDSFISDTEHKLNKQLDKRTAKHRDADNKKGVIVEHVTNRNTKTYRKPCTFKLF